MAYKDWVEVIDVSSYQGIIDWEKVKADGIKGAIIRSYTSKGLDTQFSRNVSECRRLGILYGFYLYSYARTVAAAKVDAERMLSLDSEVRPPLGYWYDMEWNKQATLGRQMVQDICREFLNRMEDEKATCGIYCNKSWYTNYFMEMTGGLFNIWLADYHAEPQISAPILVGHQYTSNGKVAGISGKVDRDRFDNVLFEKEKAVWENCPYKEPMDDFSIVDNDVWSTLWLKWYLNALGYECYVNRHYGEVTDQQLRHFQHSIGISTEEDGVVDKRTREALKKAVEEVRNAG